MSTLKKLRQDDIKLFRESVRVERHLNHDRITPPPKRPPATPRQRQLDEQQVLREMISGDYDPADLETGDELLYLQAGLQHSLLRKLRRGQISVEAELDLHGMTVPAAKEALVAFLHECLARGRRCVRIIHGKGRRSRNGQPILKGKLNVWLRQRTDVLAFCSARPVDGGTGAAYVLLKRR